MRGNRDFTIDKFVHIVSDFTSDLLPDIMRCLPDWTEVTSSTQQTLQENQDY